MKRNEDAKRPASPTRMCVMCRGRFPKSSLRRHVLAPDGTGGLVPDPRAILPGRGHYLCASPECAEKFSKYSARPRRRRGGEGE